MSSAADIAFASLCSKLKESATNIARHSKCLAGLVNDTGRPTEEVEKEVIQSARAAAKETAVLVDLINSAPVTTSEAKRLQLNILKNCGRDCSNSVLALIGLSCCKLNRRCQPPGSIGASKKAISNPLDFLTKQEVINKCKEVAAAIKGVIEATEALKELCHAKLSAQIKEEGEME